MGRRRVKDWSMVSTYFSNMLNPKLGKIHYYFALILGLIGRYSCVGRSACSGLEGKSTDVIVLLDGTKQVS